MYNVATLMTDVPPLLHAIATRETIYRISISRLMSSFPAAQAGKATIQVQHEEDVALLEAIADGSMPLLTASLQSIPTNESAVEVFSTTMDYNPTFHEGSREEQVQDSDKLDDIVDARRGRGL